MTSKLGTAIVLVAAMALIGGLWWWRFGGNDFGLPRSGEAIKETIVIDERTGDVRPVGDQAANEKPNLMIKEVMVTDGIRHSVPLAEIQGGGPPKDGIPSIDEPKFVLAAGADFITDEEPGLAVSLNGIDRFYPFQILVWHEIVNDTFGNQRVLVTYCPLCLSGIVFDPLVQAERVEFGTSGKLWQSNLVMYDRKTDSLWSQILGEAIVGEMTGAKLKVLSSDQIRFGDWRRLHPNGEVLSRDTGARRFYGQDPYGDYYTDNSQIFSALRAQDGRLENKDFVLGVVVDGQAKAYYPPAIKTRGAVTDTFAGKTIVARYEKEIDAVRLFEHKSDGTLERINPFPSFWFSWIAAHPETELYK
jgi:hypothetical protein